MRARGLCQFLKPFHTAKDVPQCATAAGHAAARFAAACARSPADCQRDGADLTARGSGRCASMDARALRRGRHAGAAGPIGRNLAENKQRGALTCNTGTALQALKAFLNMNKGSARFLRSMQTGAAQPACDRRPQKRPFHSPPCTAGPVEARRARASDKGVLLLLVRFEDESCV